MPTLRSTLEDAHKVFDQLKSTGKFKEKVCIMGRSLGSAPTLELCAKRSDVAACVLESGYADPIPLVERRGLKIDKTTPEEDALFNNSEKIRQVTCPLLIMHGADDICYLEVTPPSIMYGANDICYLEVTPPRITHTMSPPSTSSIATHTTSSTAIPSSICWQTIFTHPR